MDNLLMLVTLVALLLIFCLPGSDLLKRRKAIMANLKQVPSFRGGGQAEPFSGDSSEQTPFSSGLHERPARSKGLRKDVFYPDRPHHFSTSGAQASRTDPGSNLGGGGPPIDEPRR